MYSRLGGLKGSGTAEELVGDRGLVALRQRVSEKRDGDGHDKTNGPLLLTDCCWYWSFWPWKKSEKPMVMDVGWRGLGWG